MRVAIVLLDTMRSFDVAAALEVFADDRSSRGVPRDEVRCVSPRGTVVLEHGLTLAAQGLDRALDADLVLVPGFADIGAALASFEAPEVRSVLATLVAAHERGAQLASMCTGAFLLARSGLLDGMRTTTHWRYAGLLRDLHPRVLVDPDVLFTHDAGRRLWTSAGVTAGIDLCLAMLAEQHGTAAAATVARSMVLPAARGGGQAQYVPPRYRAEESSAGEIEQLRALVHRELDRAWTLEELARAVGRSPRSLQRRFARSVGTTPSQWLTGERVTAARELLEGTVLTVEQIAHRVGFGSADLMRKHFAARLGVAPTRYRQSFARSD